MTNYAISKIKNDKRYIEYIDHISDEEMAGGVNMDAALDYIVAEGEARGEARGEAKKAFGIARNMLELNLPIDIIVKSTGLPIDQIESLKQKKK